ncbi:MAG: prepilin-type N-terminal cleavage/methylation domain-containing protein [Planctomyces sp.]|nr:prepilin-type N-terminal cleavage/methylation domain-containing protein [Planctomyces sp.]
MKTLRKISQSTVSPRPSINARAERRSRAGFTLLELLIVLAIILVIAAMVVPNLIGTQQQANINATMVTIKSAENTSKMFAADHSGSFLVGSGQSAWQGFINPEPVRGRQLPPYYEEPPVDAWGQVLNYEWDGTGHNKGQGGKALKPAIWSNGPNMQDDGGSGDDINNWTSATAPQ